MNITIGFFWGPWHILESWENLRITGCEADHCLAICQRVEPISKTKQTTYLTYTKIFNAWQDVFSTPSILSKTKGWILQPSTWEERCMCTPIRFDFIYEVLGKTNHIVNIKLYVELNTLFYSTYTNLYHGW